MKYSIGIAGNKKTQSTYTQIRHKIDIQINSLNHFRKYNNNKYC
jgi:hypothetical protein